MATNWLPVRMFCPNCGQKLTGYRSHDGRSTKFQCPRCRMVTISTLKQKQLNLVLTPAKGQVEQD